MKNKKLFLNIEQALFLQKIGVDMQGAAYWYGKTDDNKDYEILPYSSYMDVLIKSDIYKDQYLPTFCLQECMAALPKEIIFDGKKCFLSIDYWNYAFGYNCVNKEENISYTVAQRNFTDEDILDAAYEFLTMVTEMINRGEWSVPEDSENHEL